VFAQSSGAWSAGISGRSGTPYVHTQSTNVSGYGAYAQVPTTIRHPVLQYSTAPAFAQSSGSWSAGISLGVDCRRRRDITVHHTGVRFC
jgi:hypothetical protein